MSVITPISHYILLVTSVQTSCLQVSSFVLEKCEPCSFRNERFAFTRPASLLLEKVMAGVRAKEPILLVGETGCGKTAALQFLARYTGIGLRVVNLSQQTETTDLFGG